MDRYETVKAIGKGSFGTCLLVKHKVTGASYVMKQIPLPTKAAEQEECLQEAILMSRLHHANVVHCEDTFLHRGHLCIVMEHARGGDLEKVMKKHKTRGAAMSETIVVDIIAQLALALEHLHSRKHPVLHRDIKAANIFLVPVDSNTTAAASSGAAGATTTSAPKFHVKLGDFGVSRVLEASRVLADTTCGTPFFMAPELYRGVPYSAKADVWSLGVLAYELMSQRLPFSANSMAQLGDAVCRKSPAPLPNRYSPALRELVMNMLTKDATRRVSAADAVRSPALRARCEALLAAARTSTSASSSSSASSSASSSSASSVPRLPRISGSTAPSSTGGDYTERQPRNSAPDVMTILADGILREPEPLPSRRRRPGMRRAHNMPVVARSAPASRLPTPLTEDQRRAAIAHFVDEQATRVGLATGPIGGGGGGGHSPTRRAFSVAADAGAGAGAVGAAPVAGAGVVSSKVNEKMAAAYPGVYGYKGRGAGAGANVNGGNGGNGGLDAVKEERVPLAPMMRRGAPSSAAARPLAGQGNPQPRAAAAAAAVPSAAAKSPRLGIAPFSAVPARQPEQQQHQPVRYHPSSLEGGPTRIVPVQSSPVAGGVETRAPSPAAAAALAAAPAPARAPLGRLFNHRDDMQRKVEARVHQAQAEVRARQLTPGFAAIRSPSLAVEPSAAAARAAARARPLSSRPIWLQPNQDGASHQTPPARVPAAPAPPSSQPPGGDLGQLLAANARGAAGVRSGWKYGNDPHGMAGVMNHNNNAEVRPRSRMVSAF